MMTLKMKTVMIAAVAAVAMGVLGCGSGQASGSAPPAPTGDATAAPTGEPTAAPTGAPSAQ
jgi:flagellar hook-length control protein FliK